jgi:hypothetical protein
VLRLLFLRLLDLHTYVARCSATILERATTKAWTIMVVTFPDDFATADNDTAVTVVKLGLPSLLEAEGHIGIVTRRHFDDVRKSYVL